MVVLDLIQETPATSKDILVDTKAKNDLKTISFATLLAGMNKDKEGVPSESDEKVSLEALLSKQQQSDTKSSKESLNNLKSTLLELEGENFSQDVDSDDLELLNQQLNSSLPEEDLKTVIKGAKSYLKEQILSSEGFKRSEIDKLPKTLQGLTQAAEKVGIDISKITLEEVESSIDMKNSSLQNEEKGFSETVQKQETSKELPQLDKKQNTKTSLLLFKSNTTNTTSSSVVSTQQIVNAKVLKDDASMEVKTKSKKNSDETLQMLLQGEDSLVKADKLLSSDISESTAKIIDSSPTERDSIKSLESLLNIDSSTGDESIHKTENPEKIKTDSFEVKLNEAKQMMKYLSQDVKQAIDNYKSPFTRVKVQLNPQQLGEIDLTVVQRGKNLHVNLSSNNAAINTLAMNANDLKVQLQNSGINNASLNFSNNSQGGDATNGGQSNPQQQNRQQAQQEYNYFDQEEVNEEILSSLEIIVPNYA